MLDHRRRVNISNISYAVYVLEKYKWVFSAPFVSLTAALVPMFKNVDERENLVAHQVTAEGSDAYSYPELMDMQTAIHWGVMQPVGGKLYYIHTIQ